MGGVRLTNPETLRELANKRQTHGPLRSASSPQPAAAPSAKKKEMDATSE